MICSHLGVSEWSMERLQINSGGMRVGLKNLGSDGNRFNLALALS
jgi:hypothetical protein